MEKDNTLDCASNFNSKIQKEWDFFLLTLTIKKNNAVENEVNDVYVCY